MGASLAKMEAPLLDAPPAAAQAGTVRFVFSLSRFFFASCEVKSFSFFDRLLSSLSLFVSLVVVVDDDVR